MNRHILSRRRFVAAATLSPAVLAQRLAAQQSAVVAQSAVVSGLYGTSALSAINSKSQSITVELAAGASVWKGSWKGDFGSIIPGDKVIARGYSTPTGLRATYVWVNITSFFGTVTTVGRSDYSVTTFRGLQRFVSVTANTLTATSQPFDMEAVQVGRNIQTIGLQLPDGTVQATLAVVYVSGRPTTMPNETVITTPRGQRIQVTF